MMEDEVVSRPQCVDDGMATAIDPGCTQGAICAPSSGAAPDLGRLENDRLVGSQWLSELRD